MISAYGSTKVSLRLIKSYLANRSQRITPPKSLQGSVVELFLFHDYIKDLFVLKKFTNVCNYADDITFYACEVNLKSPVKRLEHGSF